MPNILSNNIKPIAISALYHLRYFELLRYRQRKRLIIVMYHRFSAGSEPFKLNVEAFEKQIKFFNKKYNIIGFDELLRFYQGTVDLPDNPIIITIDDGYYDNYTVAYPVLRKHSVKATIFLTTDFVSRNRWLWANKLEYILKKSTKSTFVFPISGQKLFFSVKSFSDWHCSQLTIFNILRKLGAEKDKILADLADFLHVTVPEETTAEFRSLNWDDIQEMQRQGISFGSHTCSHPILSTLDKQQVRMELAVSKREIEEHVDHPIQIICYPNGQPEDISKDVLRIVKDCGYQVGVTTVPASNNPELTDRLLLSRCSFNDFNEKAIMKNLVRLPVSSSFTFAGKVNVQS